MWRWTVKSRGLALTELATASKLILVIVCLLATAGRVASAADRPRVDYAVREGQPAGTFVGDLRRDANFTAEPDPLRPTFQIRGRVRPSSSSPAPFVVDRRTGVVRTARVLDREGLCPPLPAGDWESETADTDSEKPSGCRVSFEVGVVGSRSSITVEVNVEVLDLNDNGPTFPDNQVTLAALLNFALYIP